MSKKGLTFGDVVREYFPDATPETIDYILWEKTGYPEFWNIGLDGDTPEECLRTQLKAFQEEVKKAKV